MTTKIEEKVKTLGAISKEIGLPDKTWTQLDAALLYANKLGWKVFPADGASKAPLIKAWQKNASSDPCPSSGFSGRLSF